MLLRLDPSVRISKIETGWLVDHSWEEKDEKGEDDYKNKQYAFADADAALDKAKECLLAE